MSEKNLKVGMTGHRQGSKGHIRSVCKASHANGGGAHSGSPQQMTSGGRNKIILSHKALNTLDYSLKLTCEFHRHLGYV